MQDRDLDLKNDVTVDGGKYLLSTVELLTPYNGARYETMLFKYNGRNVVFMDLYAKRYDTREQAVISHNKLLLRLRKGERIWQK